MSRPPWVRRSVALGDWIEAGLDRDHGDHQQRIEAVAPRFGKRGIDESAHRGVRHPVFFRDGADQRLDILAACKRIRCFPRRARTAEEFRLLGFDASDAGPRGGRAGCDHAARRRRPQRDPDDHQRAEHERESEPCSARGQQRCLRRKPAAEC